MAKSMKRNILREKYEKYRRDMLFNKIRLWMLKTKLHLIPKYNNRIEDIFRVKGPNVYVRKTRHMEKMMKKYHQLSILKPADPKNLQKNIADQTEKRELINILKKISPFRPLLNQQYVKAQKEVREMEKETSYTANFNQFVSALRIKR